MRRAHFFRVSVAVNKPNADAAAILPDAKAMLAKYDEVLAFVAKAPPLNPKFDDVARLRIERAHLREVTSALKAGDFAKARKACKAFDDDWVAKDHRFACTKHDSKYSPDGTHTDGRATRNMDRYVIRRDGNFIVVDLHKWVQSDTDLGPSDRCLKNGRHRRDRATEKTIKHASLREDRTRTRTQVLPSSMRLRFAI